jgi:bifunctional non-homologous end joining protein LigD
VVVLPQPIVAYALTLGSQQWLLDGEAIGENLYAFDLLENACVDLRQQPCARRLVAMYELLATVGGGPIIPVPTASTPSTKPSLLARLRQEGKEGIVFKRADSLYVPGRPASGGDQRKFKFTATVSCIVAGANGGRRSVALELFEGTARIAIGNVSIPPRTEIPSTGQVIDVQYLYAYRGGSLYQPVYLGVRTDIPPADCTVGQLKFKSADQDEEA